MEISKKISLNNKEQYPDYFIVDYKFGTVDNAALDKNGNVAVRTTEGINNQKYGKIGDSPIISADTYVNK